MTEILNAFYVDVLVIRISCFEFVSDFEIRISDLVTILRRISLISYQRGWFATTKETHSTIVKDARKLRVSFAERL